MIFMYSACILVATSTVPTTTLPTTVTTAATTSGILFMIVDILLFPIGNYLCNPTYVEINAFYYYTLRANEQVTLLY